MRAVDTNVLVRLIVGDDPKQVSVAEEFVVDGAWVPIVALAEATWVLSSAYGLSAAQLAGAVEKLLDQQKLTLQDPDVVSGALQRFKRRPAVSFSDCLILQMATKAGHLPLGTFHRNLAKLEGAVQL
jgi:predicted nucleic-acid-binding protein